MMKLSSLMHMKSDVSASIVVFLVALPLAMGISIACGYPPVAGLVTGVVGGVVVGMLSGSPLQVSGAAAGLAVVVFDGVQRFGLETMGLVLLLAGLMQIAASAMRLARWFQAVSPTVLHAMLAGIGVLIFASQVHVMLDMAPLGSGPANLAAIPEALWSALSLQKEGSALALGLGLASIAIMVFWPKIKDARLSMIPAPLVAVLAASLMAWAWNLSVSFVVIPDDLLASWRPSLPGLDAVVENPAILGAALQLALIASAESLLCASAVDQMHDGERTNYGRELAAQGVGNAICGLLGALPMTGVIVRSSANVQAGAKTRLSTILHGVWLLLFVTLLPGLLRYVPTSALAGLLVYTGVKLLNVKMMRELVRHGKGEVFIYAATVGIIVGVDLLLGVLAGLALAGMRLLHSLSHLSITTEPAHERGEVVVSLRGAATFLRLPTLSTTLETLPPTSRIVLQSHELHLVDHACMQHLEMWRRRHIGRGGQVLIEGGFRWTGTLASAQESSKGTSSAAQH
jgi:MFS superfamily sulfate permease-like transporter